MKYFLILLTTTIFIANQPDYTAVISAIRNANIAEISKHMDANVEVTVGDKDGTYNKTEATNVVRSFFDKNKPQGCSMVHSGAARDNGSFYCIGNLAAGGLSFRVYIYFKKVGSNYLIQEMRFEEN